MIRVRFPAPTGCQTSLLVTGHSGSADKGSDLVCSAVSALILTYLGGVETTLSGVIEGNVSSGVCDVQITVPEHRQRALVEISQVFRYGFERLAEQYPTFIINERIS